MSKIQKLTCVRLKMSDLAIFREKHTFNFKDFTCKKKSTIFVIFIFISQTFGIGIFLPDHQSMIVGNPVTLGCSVQANPMHTTGSLEEDGEWCCR